MWWWNSHLLASRKVHNTGRQGIYRHLHFLCILLHCMFWGSLLQCPTQQLSCSLIWDCGFVFHQLGVFRLLGPSLVRRKACGAVKAVTSCGWLLVALGWVIGRAAHLGGLSKTVLFQGRGFFKSIRAFYLCARRPFATLFFKRFPLLRKHTNVFPKLLIGYNQMAARNFMDPPGLDWIDICPHWLRFQVKDLPAILQLWKCFRRAQASKKAPKKKFIWQETT